MVSAEELKAITHPLRQEILDVFHHQDALWSPVELAQRLRKPTSSVSYHVRVLANACGALELVRTEPVRGSTKHYYRGAPKFFALPWVKSMFPDPESNNAVAR